MKDNGTKIHIKPEVKYEVQKEALTMSKNGPRLTMSDIIQKRGEALKRLKKEYPEIYRNVIGGIFS